MKIGNLLSRIKLACEAACKYWIGHAYSTDALNSMYRREWHPDGDRNRKWASMICINSLGDYYQVTLTVYLNGEQLSKDTWLAYYGWAGSGMLVEMGGTRCCFFDMERKLLYLESVDATGRDRPLELFISIK
jgi:hypothetical protein